MSPRSRPMCARATTPTRFWPRSRTDARRLRELAAARLRPQLHGAAGGPGGGAGVPVRRLPHGADADRLHPGVSQFDSVFKPVIILSSVLLSTMGVLLGLLVFRMPFGIIMTGVGVISLAGVVVNNAIVLDRLHRRSCGSATDWRARGARGRRQHPFPAGDADGDHDRHGTGAAGDRAQLRLQRALHALNPELYWGGEQAAWWGPMAIAVIAGTPVRDLPDPRDACR